ncbi:MAG: hypothetical protein M1818_002792 [Claussenomyces sp. TS43310]|nr:MAG: hypothetical protein M1818_002792 [Claussenomyces sp. TS43310]
MAEEGAARVPTVGEVAVPLPSESAAETPQQAPNAPQPDIPVDDDYEQGGDADSAFDSGS